MSNIAVQKVEDGDLKTLPIFEQTEKRMPDVRRRAFELFERRGRELGHELEDWLKAEQELLGWPAAQLAENDKEYEFEITLASFGAKEVEVTASPSEIIVQAETKAERNTEEANIISKEFGSSDVYRRIKLPQPINVDKTSAIFDKGILRVTAAKATSEERPVVAARA